jgi:prophage tail gpP-like protein
VSVLPPHEVALEIGGKGYLGWTEIAIERAIDAMVGSFDLTLASKDKTGAEDWPIEEGAVCRVLLGGEVLITGYVDSVKRSIAAEERGIAVRGRDKAADLVDCSAIHKPGSWKDQKLEAIAKALAAPFGIEIKVTGDTGAKFKRFAVQPGETVFAAIDRMARYRGLVAYSPGDGTVLIGNPDSGARSGRIEEGVNMKLADMETDVSDRFSQYVVKGQSSGDDNRHGKAVAQVKGEAKDAGVTRYRPLLVIGEDQTDAASARKRAEWEAAVRSGRAKRLTVTVPGWLTDEGKVWAPGARSAVKIPSCKVEGDLLIERVAIRRNAEDGTVTELGLVPPAAWTQLAEPEEKVR